MPIRAQTVADVMRADTPVVPRDAKLGDLVDLVLRTPEVRVVGVVDEQNALVGIVVFRAILRAVNARLGAKATGPASLLRWLRDLASEKITDFMQEPVAVLPNTPLAAALEIMETKGVNDLFVADDAHRVVGVLYGNDILRLARDLVREGDDAASKPM